MDDAAEFRTERDGAVLVVTLDHVAVGNALSAAAATALADVIDATAEEGAGVRAVLLRAEGKHFCTGADLSGRKSGGGSDTLNGNMVRRLARTHHRAVASVVGCRVPVVAAVQGTAQGFGLHLALAADFVVAATGATFREPFSDRGFSVDSGGSWLLPRLIGLTRAKQMIYLASTVDAPTALTWGLVHDVVAPDALDAAARGLAVQLASRPTQALAASKRLLHDSSISDLGSVLHAESMAVELTLRSDDFKEGMRAFFEKRPPDFTGT